MSPPVQIVSMPIKEQRNWSDWPSQSLSPDRRDKEQQKELSLTPARVFR